MSIVNSSPLQGNYGLAARIVAGFDLAVTLPLAIPVLGAVWINALMGGFGFMPQHAVVLSPLGLLFLHLAGILGVLWNAARLWRPLPWLLAMDCIGRLAVAVLFLGFLMADPISPIFGLFAFTEALGAVIQAAAVARGREHTPG